MKGKIIAGFFVAVGAAALAGAGYAQTTRSMPNKMEQGAESTKVAVGLVSYVNAKAGKISVRTDEEELSLVAQSSTIKKSLESIRVGEKVNVSYLDQGLRLIALSVSTAEAPRDRAGLSRKTY
jgi:hypothetical protein